VGRDQDDLRRLRARPAGELTGNVKAVLLAEIDVHERDVGLHLLAVAPGIRAGRYRADDTDPLAHQQLAGGLEEFAVVIDDDAAHGHAFQVAARGPAGALPPARDSDPPLAPGQVGR